MIDLRKMSERELQMMLCFTEILAEKTNQNRQDVLRNPEMFCPSPAEEQARTFAESRNKNSKTKFVNDETDDAERADIISWLKKRYKR